MSPSAISAAGGFADSTMQAVEYALKGVARRADVHSQNIANANTPNYQAQRVDFESLLAGALERGRVAELRGPAIAPTGDMPDQHGNNVDLEGEMVGLLKNNLTQDAMVASYNFKMNVLRTAIGSR